MPKYASTKLRAGDYVIPSDDAHTLYRVSTYEDGRVHGLDRGPEVVTLWLVRSCRFPSRSALSVQEIRDLDWREVSSGHRTKKEAMASVFGGSTPEHPLGSLLP